MNNQNNPQEVPQVKSVEEPYREIILKHGHITLVDEKDFEVLSKNKWYLSTHKYAYGWVNSKTRFMHRVILGLTDPKIKVDHINGNRLDNRRINLRTCTHQENIRNTKKTKGTSIYKGIGWDKHNNKWKAAITVNEKGIHLGYFHNEIDGAKAYDEAAIKYFGEFACINFKDK